MTDQEQQSADHASPATSETETKPDALYSARTLVSALIYGVIGALVGRFIGRIGDQPDRKVGQAILPWVGGILGAFIAAYTASKTENRENREEAERSHKARARAARAATSAAAMPSPASSPTAETPEFTVQTGSSERDGTVIPSARQLAV